MSFADLAEDYLETISGRERLRGAMGYLFLARKGRKEPRSDEQRRTANAKRMRDYYSSASKNPAWRAKKAAAVRRWRLRQPAREYTVTVRVVVKAKSRRAAVELVERAAALWR